VHVWRRTHAEQLTEENDKMIRVMTISNGKLKVAEWDARLREPLEGLRILQAFVGGYINDELLELTSVDGKIIGICNEAGVGEPSVILWDGRVINGNVVIIGIDDERLARSLTDADLATIGTHAIRSDLEPLNEELVVWAVFENPDTTLSDVARIFT
jgi:hypothetical protein